MTADQFWTWFNENEPRLLGPDADPEEFLTEAQRALTMYRRGLEVIVEDDEDVRELIISADGDPDLFAAVEQLIDAAPQIDRWTFTALKPARGFDFVLETPRVRLNPEEIVFEPLKNDAQPRKLGIRVYVPKGDVHDEWKRVVATALQTGLGERVCADLHLEVAPLTTSPDDHIPLRDLSAYIDWFHRKPAPA